MTQSPNILLITTDQQHYAAIGKVTGMLKTPALDRLADEGTHFERAYCANPLCSPSRASIITGQYPSTHGCWTIGTKLDEDRQTVGQLLGEAGYATSLIGKAHFQPLQSLPDQVSLEAPPTLRDLDFWREFSGPYYGFEHIELARNHGDEYWAGQHYALWMEEQGLTNWRDYFQDEDEEATRHYSWELPEQFHYTTFVGERSIAAIESAVAADKPFFTWASFQDPHPPYLVPEPWASMYSPDDITLPHVEPHELDLMPPWFQKTQEANPDFSEWQETPFQNHGFESHLIDEAALRKNIAVYYGMISFVDHEVGRILDRLDELGVSDNTLVVFTSDHGHFLGQHGLIAKGAFHYEDLLKVPMLARYPGKIMPGHSTRAIQSLVDLAPTFLDFANLDIPLDMQGVSQASTWAGTDEMARDHAIVENRHQPTKVHLRTYIEQRYKLTKYRDQPFGDLFDLDEDPGETHNLYDEPSKSAVRGQLAEDLANAELRREVSKYPRIARA